MAAIQAWAVAGSFALMAASNYLAMNKVFGGKDNKELSDSHPTYVSPDGPTFAIWGFIYLLEAVLVVTQLSGSDRVDEIFAAQCTWTGLSVRGRLVLAFLANAVWLPVFNNERFWTALGIMAAYLVVLASVYSDLNVTITNGISEAITLTAGIAMNTSWIVVAFMVSVFFCGGTAGWQDQYGVAGSTSAAIGVVLLVTVLGCERVFRAGDLHWAFVASWALRGIYRMQTIPDKVRFPIRAMNAQLGATARLGSAVIAAAIVVQVGVFLYRKSSSATEA